MNVRTSLLLGIVAVIALAFVSTAIESGTASAGGSPNGLHAYVQATNPGPLSACRQDGSNCTDANTVRHYVYVSNGNGLVNSGAPSRADVRNAFVVSSVDQTVFVDGVEVPEYGGPATPPPNAMPRFWSGHWPSSVRCPSPPDPCNVVDSPAVLPGENTAILFTGWAHGDEEFNGVYVFRFTVHGTLNGTPVDLTASSPEIAMISSYQPGGG